MQSSNLLKTFRRTAIQLRRTLWVSSLLLMLGASPSAADDPCLRDNRGAVTAYAFGVSPFSEVFQWQHVEEIATGRNNEQVTETLGDTIFVIRPVTGFTGQLDRIAAALNARWQEEATFRKELERLVAERRSGRFSLANARFETGEPQIPAGYVQGSPIEQITPEGRVLLIPYVKTTKHVVTLPEIEKAQFKISVRVWGSGFVQVKKLSLISVQTRPNVEIVQSTALDIIKKNEVLKLRRRLIEDMRNLRTHLEREFPVPDDDLKFLCSGDGGSIDYGVPLSILGKPFELPVTVTTIKVTTVDGSFGDTF